MNRIFSQFLLFLTLLMGFQGEARAWSSAASKTLQKIGMLEHIVEEYRTDHGKLPDQEEFHGRLRSDEFAMIFENGYPFIDDWHREIRYRIPGVHGEYDLLSTGADEIDNNGGKDDISNWMGVNEGYYWKRLWPFGRHILWIAFVLAFGLSISKAFHAWQAAVPLAGVILGLGISLGSFCLRHPGHVPSRNFPLTLAILCGLLILLPSLAKFIAFLKIRTP